MCVQGVVSASFQVSRGLWLYSLDGRVLDTTGKEKPVTGKACNWEEPVTGKPRSGEKPV